MILLYILIYYFNFLFTKYQLLTHFSKKIKYYFLKINFKF
jgi:hypothetical protein